MKKLPELQIKIFADGADKEGMLEMYRHPYIKGFTTNPTLMRKAGVSIMRCLQKILFRRFQYRSISFEVFFRRLQ